MSFLKIKALAVALLVAATGLAADRSWAEPEVQPDVVYVAIGSRHYVEAEDPHTRALGEIRGANRSARQVSKMMAEGGAAAGVLLTSSRNAPVTRDEIFAALDAGIAEASVQDDPFLFVYFAGHGLSEGFAWTHLAIPGDIVVALDEAGEMELDLETAYARAVLAGELVDRLNQTGAPYALILDACYEGSPVDLEAYQAVFSAQNRAFLSDMADILRFKNQFRQPSPVIFSAQPGTLVPTAKDPSNALLSLAPMARRLALLARAEGNVTLEEMIAHLTDPAADSETDPGVSFAQLDAHGDKVLLASSSASPIAPLELKGGGSGPLPCCRAADAPDGMDGMTAYRGALTASGPPGEWVTDGERQFVEVDDVMLDPTDLGGVSIVLWPEDDANIWTADFSTGRGAAFEVGRVYRDDGADDGPALSVSGDGRGCSEDTGAFKVLDARYDEVGLKRLEIAFTQYCDGEDAAAEGRLVLERP